MARQRLKDAAEKAKIELSSSQKTNVNLPFVTATDQGPKHLNIDITRAKFEQLIDDLVEKTKEPCKKVMSDADLTKNDIDHVILVGGSTRIPKIQENVKEFFGKDPHKGVNPDEVVAVGAAIQGGVMSGDVEDVVLLDVTPLTLGIETQGGIMTQLIEKNTTIPTSKTETFTTAANNQTSVEVHVLQGERTKAADNRTLGRFHLDGIPPAPRGTPQIDVTFDIDADGVLNVSAKDKGTGKEQSIRIESTSGLSEDEIERMKQDAEEHAEEDEKIKERVEKLNKADNLIFSTEKQLEEHEDKISDNNKEAIKEKLDKLKELHKEEKVEELDDAIEELNQAWSAASQEIYAAAQEQGGQAAGQPGGGPQAQGGQQQTQGDSSEDEEAVDADYEVVDEEDDEKKS